jgi:Arc/MetJ-type ribon-helix-helix transcriptional regulator
MAKKTTINERVVKVPLPIPLIRRMDETIVAERGGFRTRAELMREAIENLLNELDFPEAPAVDPRDASEFAPERLDRAGPGPGDNEHLPKLLDWERDELTLPDLSTTALPAPTRQPRLAANEPVSVSDEPLLGLHNRDYVSVWALHRLARYTVDRQIDFDEYLQSVTRAAWYYGWQLRRLEREAPGSKLTVLFPTNAAKRPSAERGFQNFAIGSVVRRGDSPSFSTAGPLFAWRAIQVAPADTAITALTDCGWQLILDLDGLSLELPHPSELATRFLSYLAEHAPGDRWGFDHLVRAASDGPDRNELVRSFTEKHPEWTAATASSVAQGYIARSREWGLLEPRLVEGRYWLTDAGRKLARELD